MQHSNRTTTARAQARAVAVPATSSEVALLFPAIAGLLLALLVLLL
jgi:hypothetical protein